MGGALIETEARRLRDQAKEEAARETAIRLLQIGKLTIEEIAIGSGLTAEEVKELKNIQPV